MHRENRLSRESRETGFRSVEMESKGPAAKKREREREKATEVQGSGSGLSHRTLGGETEAVPAKRGHHPELLGSSPQTRGCRQGSSDAAGPVRRPMTESEAQSSH